MLKLYNCDEKIISKDSEIVLKYEAPNPYLYRFYGLVSDKNGNSSPLTFNNFLLRGCNLRNVKYVIGVVSYTGYFMFLIISHDTKIMLNSFKARSKKSKLEVLM